MRRTMPHPTPSLSGTPAEAGVRAFNLERLGKRTLSQWNPRRSRGASLLVIELFRDNYRLSGTPAEAGVRVFEYAGKNHKCRRLSGTPAEAGVRELCAWDVRGREMVSVEPPPKQGCESAVAGNGDITRYVSVEPPPKQGCESI